MKAQYFWTPISALSRSDKAVSQSCLQQPNHESVIVKLLLGANLQQDASFGHLFVMRGGGQWHGQGYCRTGIKQGQRTSISHFQIRPEHLDDVSFNLTNLCQRQLLLERMLIRYTYFCRQLYFKDCMSNFEQQLAGFMNNWKQNAMELNVFIDYFPTQNFTR